jgi:hypothetical protein
MTFEDFQTKLAETKKHADDLGTARTDAMAKADVLAAAQSAKQAADAAVGADVATLEADRAELHNMIDAIFPSGLVTPLLALLLFLAVEPASAADWEFPAGVPVKAGEVTWYAPTDHYQNGGTIHWRRYNIAANPDPHGNGNLGFPWRTGGIDKSPNARSFVFRKLPAGSSISWWRERDQRGIPDVYYRWRYPPGTVFGEVLEVDKRPFEVRVMTRGPVEWDFRVYRPYATRADVASHIVSEKTAPGRLRDTQPDRRVIDESAIVHTVELSAEGVRDVLARPFQDVTGRVWLERDGQRAYAPAAAKTGQIVPVGFQGHFFGAQTCRKCHDTTGTPARHFDMRREWYGNIRGSDGVFSFSPFEDSSAARNGASLQVHFAAGLPLVRAQ